MPTIINNITIIGVGSGGGGLRPLTLLKAGDWPPHFCISYCVVNIVTISFSNTDTYSSILCKNLQVSHFGRDLWGTKHKVLGGTTPKIVPALHGGKCSPDI